MKKKVTLSWRREFAVILRMAGYSYPDIAKRIKEEIDRINEPEKSNYNPAQAYRDVTISLNAIGKREESESQLRSLTKLRLNGMIKSFYDEKLPALRIEEVGTVLLVIMVGEILRCMYTLLYRATGDNINFNFNLTDSIWRKESIIGDAFVADEEE